MMMKFKINVGVHRSRSTIISNVLAIWEEKKNETNQKHEHEQDVAEMMKNEKQNKTKKNFQQLYYNKSRIVKLFLSVLDFWLKCVFDSLQRWFSKKKNSYSLRKWMKHSLIWAI